MEKKKEDKKLDDEQLQLTVTDKGTDPTSHQRGRPTERRQQISDRINALSQFPQWARHKTY
jgi:hypothetical protein